MVGQSFICGCGHSGTTLLANIMAAHPRVFVPLYETEMFLKGRDIATQRLADLQATATADGKLYLVEKTPRHVRHLPLIRELVPGARFILPVRDGRDVAASIARRVGSPQPGVRRWISDNRIVLGERSQPDVFIYRHEDLVDDPAAVVRTICSFADIPYLEEMLRYHEHERLWFGTKRVGPVTSNTVPRAHAKRRAWQVNQPIFDNRGSWRESLSEEDIRPLLEGEGATVMRAFGYLN